MGVLLIIDPATERAETEATARIADRWAGSTHATRPALDGWDAALSPDAPELAGVIVFGSASSVHDPSPWRDALIAFLRPALSGDRRLPILGICYAHQLIGTLAGARVVQARADGAKVVGIQEIERVGPTALLDDGATSFRAAVSHRELLDRVPDGFDLTMRRDDCPVDALQHHQRPIFTTQFHPEMTDSSLGRSGYPGPYDAERIAEGDRLIDGFLAICREACQPGSRS